MTADTARFRFELPTPRHVLGLPAASHVMAVDNAMVARAYTPVTLDKFDKVRPPQRPPPHTLARCLHIASLTQDVCLGLAPGALRPAREALPERLLLRVVLLDGGRPAIEASPHSRSYGEPR